MTPLHKGGVRNDINNYRPISILPTLSKILKKHVENSLIKFLRDNNLIYCGVDKGGGGQGGLIPPQWAEWPPLWKDEIRGEIEGGTMTLCNPQK